MAGKLQGPAGDAGTSKIVGTRDANQSQNVQAPVGPVKSLGGNSAKGSSRGY